MVAFTLHPRLAADTLPVGDLVLCRVLLMNDRRFPWLVLVPRLAGVVELVDLDAVERGLLIEEAAAAERALMRLCRPDKLNLGALGNLVPQLHLHVVARRRTDLAWPGPVWGSGPAEPWPGAEGQALATDLARALGVESAEGT